MNTKIKEFNPNDLPIIRMSISQFKKAVELGRKDGYNIKIKYSKTSIFGRYFEYNGIICAVTKPLKTSYEHKN